MRLSLRILLDSSDNLRSKLLKNARIRGSKIFVEIDEIKFGKKKFNKGHRVEGFWVFGGVDRTAEKIFFVVIVLDRSRMTLENLILSHVKAGRIIHFLAGVPTIN